MNDRDLASTITGEVFHPVRIYYKIINSNKLIKCFLALKCMTYDALHNRWVWLYQREAKKIKFRVPYSAIDKKHHPIVLGSFYIKNDETYIEFRSFERAVAALQFFGKNIPKNVAEVDNAVIVNKCFESPIEFSVGLDAFFGEIAPVAPPEDIMDRIEQAVEGLDDSKRPEVAFSIIEESAKQPLPKVERFPVHTNDDDIMSFKLKLILRDAIALEHWKGNVDYTLFDAMTILTKDLVKS
ncbi:conserved hypothetical protein [Gammaproteobacteria bacterium]